MKKVRITVKRITVYDDLINEYENPIEHACLLNVNDTFISENASRPECFCDSAWETIFPFVKALAEGKGYFYDNWMKNPYSAMISCNDGFRPVSFLLEVIE